MGNEEIRIPFDPVQHDLYRLQVKHRRDIPGCIYPLWPSLKGRGRMGEFPLIVAREYFLGHGYKVLHSDSSRDDPYSFICASYPGLRKERPFHPGFRRMVEIFGDGLLRKFNQEAEAAKLRTKKSTNRGGGDPDLFVYKDDGNRERFFVEVKHRDSLHENQKIVFRLMRKHLCPVKIVRIYPRR
jgi:hypothetical protein